MLVSISLSVGRVIPSVFCTILLKALASVALATSLRGILCMTSFMFRTLALELVNSMAI